MEHETGMNCNTAIITIFMMMFGVIATVIGRNKAGISHRLKAFFSNKRTYMDDSTEARYNETANTLLFTIISIVSLSFIATAEVPESQQTWYATLAMASGGLTAFFLLKSLVYYTVNSVFFSTERNRKWMSAYHLMTSLSALLLYPISLLAVFAKVEQEIIIYSLLFTLILYEILLFYKLFANFKTKKYGFVLVFLYFCSVELIPIMSLWHFCDQINRNLTT